MLTRFLDPKNDVAFKKIFGTEKNKGLLLSFLNTVLKEQIKHEIKSVSFLKTEQDPETAAKKQSIVDVLCVDETGVQYIIEMQVARTAGFEKRAQLYASKAYISQMDKGEKATTDKDKKSVKYEDLKEVIFLAITDYIAYPDKQAYKSDHATLDIKTHTRDIEGFSFTFVELPKFAKQLKQSKRKLKDLSLEEKWYYFLRNAPDTKPEDLEQLTKTDVIIKEAYDALDRFGWSDNELLAYDQEIKRVLDNEAVERQKFMEIQQKLEETERKLVETEQKLIDAEAKGIAEERLEIAKAMIKNNIDLKTISHCTGLDEYIIKDLGEKDKISQYKSREMFRKQ